MSRRTLGAALLVAASMAASASAVAHAFLQSASPAVGGNVPTSPASITLDFSEAVEPGFTTVTVSRPDGARADKGDLHVSADDARRLILGVTMLADGVYTVVWHVVSVDTHKTEGSYRFSVGRQ